MMILFRIENYELEWWPRSNSHDNSSLYDYTIESRVATNNTEIIYCSLYKKMNKQSVSVLFATPMHKINRLIIKFKKLKKSTKENNRKIRAKSKKKLKLHHLEYIKSEILSNNIGIILLKRLRQRFLEGLMIFKSASDYCIRKILRNGMHF